MQKIFSTAWLTSWLNGVLPNSVFKFGAKTPWYRRSWAELAPWIAGAVALPVVATGAWFGLHALTQRNRQPES